MTYFDHGHRHRPGGSDPIGGGSIAFDVENAGGWLHVTTEDQSSFDPPNSAWTEDLQTGLALYDGQQASFYFQSKNDTVIYGPDSGGNLPAFYVYMEAYIVLATNMGDITITSVVGDIELINADLGNILLQSPNYVIVDSDWVDITATSDVTFNLGGDFILNNLPTAAPTGTGKVWNDLGTLRIT